MPSTTRRLALLLPLLAACTAAKPPPGGWVSLPPDATTGAGDPTRAAVFNTAYVFGTPSSLAGKPAEAARAVAQYEFLATEIPTGPRWQSFDPVVSVLLAQGRVELRNALGIPVEAETQPIIETMFSASRALRVGDAAAAERVLSAPFYTRGGAATLALLGALPPLPKVNQAAVATEAALNRMGRDGYSRGGDGARP